MADKNHANANQRVMGSLESQRQPDPVADSLRLAQEKGSTHQFVLPEVHDVPHTAASALQTPENTMTNESRANDGRKHATSAKMGTGGTKRATSAKKSSTSVSKGMTTKRAGGGTRAQHQTTGRQSHKQ